MTKVGAAKLLRIGMVASHTWGRGSIPAETRGQTGGLASPVIQVEGRPQLQPDAGTEFQPLRLQDKAHLAQ